MSDNITLPRATVQQALGAIDLYQRNEHCEDEFLIAGHFLRTALEQQAEPVCWCHKCNENRLFNNIPFSMTRMIVCPTCGNKRCPKASDHRLDCTNSNAAGQPGSVYPANNIKEGS